MQTPFAILAIFYPFYLYPAQSVKHIKSDACPSKPKGLNALMQIHMRKKTRASTSKVPLHLEGDTNHKEAAKFDDTVDAEHVVNQRTIWLPDEYGLPEFRAKSPLCTITEVFVFCIVLCGAGIFQYAVAQEGTVAQQHLKFPESPGRLGNDICNQEIVQPGVVVSQNGIPSQQTQVYRHEIDGMRALAIIPVVFFHVHLGFPGGFAGVDVFYVISGFLVTRILLADRERPISEFWVRRVRRLFPALALLVMAVLPAGWLMVESHMFQSLCEQTRAALFCIANFYYFHQTDYFSINLDSPMLHCWSLAVEEQFYLVYPFLLRFLHRFQCMPRATALALAIVFVTSFSLCLVWMQTGASSFAFYMLPSRAWEFALGGMVVVFENDLQLFDCLVLAEICGWLGVGMVMVSYIAFKSSMPYPGWVALLPCFGTALVIASQRTHRTSCGRLLSSRWLARIGNMSYPLYLWHWPIYVLVAYATDSFTIKHALLVVAITVCIAVVSHIGVEPFFRSKTRIPDRRFVTASFLIWLSLITLTTVAVDYSSRMTASVVQNSSCSNDNTLLSFMQTTDHGEQCLKYPSESQLSNLLLVNASTVSEASILTSKEYADDMRMLPKLGPTDIIAGSKNEVKHPSIAFIGSSHCVMYLASLHRVANETGKPAGYLCKAGMASHFEEPPTDFDKLRLSTLEKWHPDVIVWMEAWHLPTSNKKYNNSNFIHDLNLLLDRSKRVIILGDVPPLPFDNVNDVKSKVLQRARKESSFSFLNNLSEPDVVQTMRGPLRVEVEDTIRHVASNQAWQGRVKFVSVDPYFIHRDTKRLMPLDPCMGTLVYRDFSHLNVDGARRVEPLFRKEIFGQAVCE